MSTSSTGTRSGRSLSTALAAQLAVRLLGLGSGVVVAASLARGLDHTEFGQFTFVLAMVGVAVNLGDLGLTNTVVRQLALHPDQQARTVGALVLARVVTGVVGAAFVVGIVTTLETSATVRLIALLAAGTLLLAPLGSLQAVGQAQLRIGAQNVLLALQSILWTASVLVLALADAPMIVFGVAFLLTSAIQLTVTWWMFRGSTEITFDGAGTTLATILRIALPIAVGGLLVTSYYRAGGILLYHFRGPEEVADYSAAYRFLDMLQVIPMTLLTALLPLLSSTWRVDDDDGRRRRTKLFEFAFSIVALAALPIAVGGALVADPLVRLIYGEEFSQASGILAVLILSFPAICAGYIATGLALSSGRTTLYAVIAGAVALASVPANLLFIPFGGGVATAWVTVGAEYASAGTMLLVLRRSARVRFPIRSWAGTVAATCLMTAAVYPLRDLSLALSIPVGTVAAAAGALCFKAITVDDLRRLIDRREKEWV